MTESVYLPAQHIAPHDEGRNTALEKHMHKNELKLATF